jgi:hypothetical protein
VRSQKSSAARSRSPPLRDAKTSNDARRPRPRQGTPCRHRPPGLRTWRHAIPSGAARHDRDRRERRSGWAFPPCSRPQPPHRSNSQNVNWAMSSWKTWTTRFRAARCGTHSWGRSRCKGAAADEIGIATLEVMRSVSPILNRFLHYRISATKALYIAAAFSISLQTCVAVIYADSAESPVLLMRGPI